MAPWEFFICWKAVHCYPYSMTLFPHNLFHEIHIVLSSTLNIHREPFTVLIKHNIPCLYFILPHNLSICLAVSVTISLPIQHTFKTQGFTDNDGYHAWKGMLSKHFKWIDHCNNLCTIQKLPWHHSNFLSHKSKLFCIITSVDWFSLLFSVQHKRGKNCKECILYHALKTDLELSPLQQSKVVHSRALHWKGLSPAPWHLLGSNDVSIISIMMSPLPAGVSLDRQLVDQRMVCRQPKSFRSHSLK